MLFSTKFKKTRICQFGHFIFIAGNKSVSVGVSLRICVSYLTEIYFWSSCQSNFIRKSIPNFIKAFYTAKAMFIIYL